MSLKDLFANNKKRSEANAKLKSLKDLNEQRGRAELLSELRKKDRAYTPNVDFSRPGNFARYGSAKDYYTYSLKRIYEDYPYDGSLQEKLEWDNNSTYLDTYIFDNLYPRTNGYVLFSPGGWGDQGSTSDVTYKVGLPSTLEYILVKGGPTSDGGHKVTSVKSKANIYDTAKGRGSNLKFDLEASGSTVEFWLKVDDFVNARTATSGNIIFDLWNGAASNTQDYGRFTVMLNNHVTGTMSGSAFAITCVSGTSTAKKGFVIPDTPAIFSTVLSESIPDSKWHHYAFVLQNTGTAGGMGGGDIKATMYRDGAFVSSVTRASNGIGEIKGLANGLHATVGAGIAWPEYAAAPGTISSVNGRGCAKLSGSLDEFRYWKTARTEKEIKNNWFVPVVGGVNNEVLDRDYDSDNVNLGVYYKFNEGITLTASVDQTILDYSGRICNGTWTGTYSNANRSTDSAMVSSGKTPREFKDPIIRAFHPDVNSIQTQLEMSGTIHDTYNSSMLFNRFPTWIREGDDGSNVLKNMTQIISSYLDTLHLQIEELPGLGMSTYTSGSQKPSEFPYYSVISKGLLLPSVFIDETIANKVLNKTEDMKFERDINDIKRLIYTNIQNNLESVLKSKGTRAAFRNLMRCYGVDSSLINVNIYANNAVQAVEDTGEYVSEKKNFVDFTSDVDDGSKHAVVLQAIDAASASIGWDNAKGYLSGSTGNQAAQGGYSLTYETQAAFPKFFIPAEGFGPVSRQNQMVALTSSIFGMHGLNTADAQDGNVTWGAAGADASNFLVVVAREGEESRRAKFILTGSRGISTIADLGLKSGYFDDVFDNSVWNFAVRVRPTNDQAGVLSGTFEPNYYVNFYGVRTKYGEIIDEFEVSESVSQANARALFSDDRVMFVGAHRTNFTGAALVAAECKVSSVRAWANYRSNADLRRSATDRRNYGITAPEQSAYLFQTDNGSDIEKIPAFIPNMKTLLLNWDFEGITGSSDAGQFVVYDFSSGSSDMKNTFHIAGQPISGSLAYQHPGLGYGFPVSSNNMVATEYLSSFRRDPLETFSTEDAVRILGDDDRAFNTDYSPVDFVLSIEKSPYEIISREMLNIFGNVSQIGNLYGRYVDKFRHKYKSLEYLRGLFFQNVKNVPDVEEFLDYYIWIDETLNFVLRQLVPIAADHIDGHDVIESHVLERNKYHHPYPTIDLQPKDVETVALGINELLYPWKFGHAPLSPNQNTNQNESCLWWKDRAERGLDGALSSSSPLGINDNREDIRRIAITEVSGNTYAFRHLARPYKISGQPSGQDKNLGDSIPLPNKKYRFLDAFYASHPMFSATRDYFVMVAALGSVDGLTFADNIKDCDDAEIPPELKKTKIAFSLQSDYQSAPSVNVDPFPVDGMNHAPFNLYSSSYSEGGYFSQVRGADVLNYNAEINDWLKDLYGDFQQNPMQGPFTEQNVGGLKYRHVYANSGRPILSKLVKSDGGNADNRVEGCELRIDGTSRMAVLPGRSPIPGLGVTNIFTNTGEGRYYRDELAKRPVNIRNIETPIFTSSAGTPSSGTVLGNYQHRYEVFSTTGRDVQKPWFRKNFDKVASTTPMAAPGKFSKLGSLGQITILLDDPTKYDAGSVDITTADGKLIEYKFDESGTDGATGTCGSTAGDGTCEIVVVQLNGLSTAADFAIQLKLAIESFNGHHGRVVVSRNGAVLSLVQRTGNGGSITTNLAANRITIIDDPSNAGPDTFLLADRTHLTGTTKNQTVFGERFSAPGGYEVMSRGFLDPETETYSVYNALPWRNRTVREQLDDKYRMFNAQFGFQGRQYLTGNIGAPIAGISPLGGHWTSSADLDSILEQKISASFHKTNRNPSYRVEYVADNAMYAATVTASTFDNFFVQHQIPQSDRQYAWITASLANHKFGVSAPLGFAPKSGYNEFVHAGPTASIEFLSASEFVSYHNNAAAGQIYGKDKLDPTALSPVFVDFVGLNYIINEPISSSFNTLGLPTDAKFTAGKTGGPYNYFNDSFIKTTRGIRTGMAPVNSLILHRQGPYGWPSWKQIRGADHTIMRHHRLHNTMSVNYARAAGGLTDTSLLYNAEEPAISTKYKEVSFATRTKDNSHYIHNRYKTLVPFSSVNSYFDDNNFNNWTSVADFPRLGKTGSLQAVIDLYEDLKDTNPGVRQYNLQEVNYSETVFPRGVYTFLGRTRGRENNIINYWREKESERRLASSTNSQGKVVEKKSIWPLDARENFVSGDALTRETGSIPTGGYGELQNPGVIYHMGSDGSPAASNLLMPTASALYNRPTPETLNGGMIVYGGDTLWEAGRQANKPSGGPFYESYDDYAEDLRAVGKDYAIVPEFRVSEYMDTYITEKAGNFLADITGTDAIKLSLTGAYIENSSTDGFYRRYATSDFLKFFQKVDEMVAPIADKNQITLKCNALMKFLPYNGFYPAQRTVQLASLFSQSYGAFIELKGDDANLRTALTPLFAPGILFNTIKSGIAVDYPIRTSGYMTKDEVTGGVGNQNGRGDAGIPRLSGSGVFNDRLPFETLLEPENYMSAQKLYDVEPGLSASLSSSAQLKGASDMRYRLAMNNFLAETVGFFLKDGEITSIASKADDQGGGRLNPLFNVKPVSAADSTPKNYVMRINISHSEIRTVKYLIQAAWDGPTTFTQEKSFVFNPPTIEMYSRQTGSLSNYTEGLTATQYYYGSSFGPPCNTNAYASNYAKHTLYTASWAPFTPPYYNGLAWIDLLFEPGHVGLWTIEDILGVTSIVRQGRYVDDPQGVMFNGEVPHTPGSVDDHPSLNSAAYMHAMQLTASLNLFKSVKVPKVTYDATGTPLEIAEESPARKWVIQPKFETPVLDFSGSNVTLPVSGSGSIAKGMWHQYGSIPGAGKGLFLQIQDPVAETLLTTYDYDLTGSLADLVGFPKEQVNIGRVGESKIVREAIVAIPYRRLDLPPGEMSFYTFDKNTIIQAALAVTEDSVPKNSVQDMIQKMRRYVIPPRFDFLTNFGSVDPIAMYIFEFEHTFDQKDLSDMWQNLPPDSLLSVKEPRETVATISHPLLAQELLSVDMANETQWLVFKVKQKASKNYFEKTADAGDDKRFKFKFDGSSKASGEIPDYSYNWPYDFFSMVELAKIGVDVSYKADLVEVMWTPAPTGQGVLHAQLPDPQDPPRWTWRTQGGSLAPVDVTNEVDLHGLPGRYGGWGGSFNVGAWKDKGPWDDER